MSERSDEQTSRRRMAAVLAADVAGYSRLMGTDEEATIAALGRARAVFRESIGSHDGRVVDTAGDSVLAVFDSIIEAVRCALSVQETLATRNADVPEDRRMQFRIGVHFGDIVEQEDGTIYGDGVNIAARLEGLGEPGGLTISGTVHEHVEGKLGIGFADLGEQEVKNIAKPVHAYRVQAAGESASQPQATRRGKRLAIVGTLATAVALIAIAAVWWRVAGDRAPQMVTAVGDLTDDPGLAMPAGPSIAVLPFENLSGSDEYEYIADGMTEEIITALSRFPEFMVIARNSVMKYKANPIDVRSVGDELGVRYVLEGSVRRFPDKVRVTAQLLDAETGAHIWADNFDHESSDILEIQDQVAANIVATLAGVNGQVVLSELARIKRTESRSAYDLVLRAWVRWENELTPQAHAEARKLLEEAVQIDPEYADAHAMLAFTYMAELWFGYNPQPKAFERAGDAAQRAVSLDPSSGFTHYAMAAYYYMAQDIERFEIEAGKSLDYNPNDAEALALFGQYMINIGKLAPGYALLKKAVALNPTHPPWYHIGLYVYHYIKGDYKNALVEAKNSFFEGQYWSYFRLAVCYGQLGMKKQAQEAVTRLTELSPNFAVIARDEMRQWNVKPEYIEDFVDGVRKAGLEAVD